MAPVSPLRSAAACLYLWHSVANHILTAMCNVVSDLNLSDIMTGYKAFRTSLLKTIRSSNRFGIEPELTIKVARRYAETTKSRLATTDERTKTARRSGSRMRSRWPGRFSVLA